MCKNEKRGLSYHRFQEEKSKLRIIDLLKNVFTIEFINNNILNHSIYSIVKKEDLKNKKVIKFSENKCKCNGECNKKEKFIAKKENKPYRKRKSKQQKNTEE